jgi:putative ABC transport system permease protein
MNKPEILDLVKTALFDLKINKMRTFLTVLGIIVGIGSFVLISAIGKGKTEMMEKMYSHMGDGCLLIQLNDDYQGDYPVTDENKFSEKDFSRIKSNPNIKLISPYFVAKTSQYSKISNENGKTIRDGWTNITGCNTDLFKIASLKLLKGRVFSNNENVYFTVIGDCLAKELFGTDNVVGRIIILSIGKTLFKFSVIGVVENPYMNSMNGTSVTKEYQMFIPANVFAKIDGKDMISNMICKVVDNGNLIRIQNQLLNYVAKIKNTPKDIYKVEMINKEMVSLNKEQKRFNWVMGMISLISLIVGGIVIMNIMLVSVTERTVEIGVRKALGARNKDIVFQFLIEAVVLTIFGGFAGIIFGYISSKILSTAANVPTALGLNVVILSFFISFAIGVVFGIYPALRAAKLKPIDALRKE